jgi:hypothetical protein
MLVESRSRSFHSSVATLALALGLPACSCDGESATGGTGGTTAATGGGGQGGGEGGAPGAGGQGGAPVSSCTDGATNGEETDVDCGGTLCAACTLGKACGVPGDCDTNVCEGGTCACPAGKGDCDGEFANGCEVDFASSAANCGQCGNACGSGLECTASACVRPLGCDAASPETIEMIAGFSVASIGLDSSCNVYLGTLLTGIDEVRRVAPNGQLTSWAYPADFTDGHYVGVSPDGQSIWATYQEKQWGLARVANDALALVLPGANTSGAGPWSTSFKNHGPAGLAVDASGVAFVGNVLANGQVHRVAPDGTTTLLGLGCATRVAGLARGLGDDLWIACGAELLRGNVGTDTSEVFATTTSDIRAIAADYLTGDLYVETSDGALFRYATEGAGAVASPFANVTGEGLLAVGYDNALWRVAYVLNGPSAVERYPLPGAP